ncbi:MAG: class II aldolase and adducin N-terminal domain-containing protein [Wolinella sp.]
MRESVDQKLISELGKISLSMFRKNFFGVFHGSISAKLGDNRFLINKRDAIFDEINKESLIALYHSRDYRWKEASIDSQIHSSIYQNISEAKYVAYCLPPFTMAYALRFNKIVPQDYFGAMLCRSIEVYNPRDFETWYERADVEIYRHMKEKRLKAMVIRGYGVYLLERDINQLAKVMAVIENSCRILYFAVTLDGTHGVQSCDIPYMI